MLISDTQEHGPLSSHRPEEEEEEDPVEGQRGGVGGTAGVKGIVWDVENVLTTAAAAAEGQTGRPSKRNWSRDPGTGRGAQRDENSSLFTGCKDRAPPPTPRARAH